ncbi:hypothetical protein AMTRI_Chr03g46250 [Amborella trichopoda]
MISYFTQGSKWTLQNLLAWNYGDIRLAILINIRRKHTNHFTGLRPSFLVFQEIVDKSLKCIHIYNNQMDTSTTRNCKMARVFILFSRVLITSPASWPRMVLKTIFITNYEILNSKKDSNQVDL